MVEATICNVTNEQDNSRLAEFAIEKFGAINLVAPFAGITADGLLIKTDRETGKVTGKMSLDTFFIAAFYSSNLWENTDCFFQTFEISRDHLDRGLNDLKPNAPQKR